MDRLDRIENKIDKLDEKMDQVREMLPRFVTWAKLGAVFVAFTSFVIGLINILI